MKYNPHDYQSFATDFVLEHPYCGLILDMGLGKSVITLTALWDLLLDSFDADGIFEANPVRIPYSAITHLAWNTRYALNWHHYLRSHSMLPAAVSCPDSV